MRLTFGKAGIRLDVDDPDLGLTVEQRQAMAFDKEVAVTAGAGTGKTHTLALRYVALLVALADAGGDDVSPVLVVTFTEKAANEMAERCVRALRRVVEVAREQAPAFDALVDGRGTALAGRLARMADRFDRARIHTFHAFCGRILDAHPAATATAPHTRPLAAGEAQLWTDRALQTALSAHLAARPLDIGPLLDCFGSRAGLMEAGRIALSRLGILEGLLDEHATGKITLGAALAEACVTVAEADQFVEATALPSLNLLVRLVAPSGGGPFVVDRLRPGIEALAERKSSDALRTYARYREVLELLRTDAGTLRSLEHHTVLGTRVQWPDDVRYRQAKEGARALMRRFADWPDRAKRAATLPTTADKALYEGLQPFSRWVLASAAQLNLDLHETRRITFEELQRRAIRSVLADEALRTVLRGQFRYLMVDEFQDTDALQWALVKALARAVPTVAEDRLFLVGDPKQAIYGFRGGDVSVFAQAIAEFGLHTCALTENFRSTPPLIDWFNRFFPAILGPEAPYLPLVAHRTGVGLAVARITCEEAVEQPEKTAALVAEALGKPDPSIPIAILLRSRTRQHLYEGALRALGVPFTVVGGVGFWSRPEVVDVVNVVCAVALGDPLSIVAALRGPLFGLPDRALHAARKDSAKLEARLLPWCQRAREVSPSTLVRQLADRMLATLEAGGEAVRAEANLRRLCDRVVSWDALGLAAVADRLLAEVDADRREAEAAVDVSSAQVVICTVHAAKGLEFPMVVVPEVSARPRSDLPGLLVARTGPGGSFRVASRVLDPDATIETRVRPGLYSALREALLGEQDAEERRLLYVAATRARDRLVFVGTEQPMAEPGARRTWMQWLTASEATQPSIELAKAAPFLPVAPPSSMSTRFLAPPTVRALDVSPSSLERLAACPARWFRRHVWRLPEGPATLRERHTALAGVRGQVLHQLLQDRVLDDPQALARRWRAAATLAAATPQEHASGLARLEAHLAGCRRSDAIRHRLAAPGADEVPFRVTHGAVTLVGRIDRLWLDTEAGGAVVLDWKSERVGDRDPVAAAQEHAVQLAGYAWAADQVIAAASGLGVVRAEVVLTELGLVVPVALTTDIPALLEQAEATATRSWTDIEAASTDGSAARPCADCGYRGRGCRGLDDPPST